MCSYKPAKTTVIFWLESVHFNLIVIRSWWGLTNEFINESCKIFILDNFEKKTGFVWAG